MDLGEAEILKTSLKLETGYDQKLENMLFIAV